MEIPDTDLYRIDITAHPLYLLVKLVMQGEVVREEQLRWDDLEKIRRHATEEMFFKKYPTGVMPTRYRS